MGTLNETLCNNELSWLEKYLSESKKNIKNLGKSWHRVYGNLSQESEKVIRDIRSYGIPVISFNDRTHFPYIEIKVNGPSNYRLEFNGLNQIKKYFSILNKFLSKQNARKRK